MIANWKCSKYSANKDENFIIITITGLEQNITNRQKDNERMDSKLMIREK